jgi:hypothetical protein
MKKSAFSLLLFLFCTTFASEKMSIVYVHIGDTIPQFIIEGITQLRLYNPTESIYFCSNSEALRKVKNDLALLSVTQVSLENLPKSQNHQKFLRETPFSDNFWTRTTERLLVIDDLIVTKNLENVFHIESDIMIYGSFRNLLSTFTANYPSVAVPFVSDELAVCSIIYFRDEFASNLLANCIAKHAKEGENDMRLPGILKEEMGISAIDHLPILPSKYIEQVDQSLFINECLHTVKDKTVFGKFFDNFCCIFDGGSFGVFLSREDRTICRGTIFDPRNFDINWKKNEQGLFIPYVNYNGFECKIFNLHIHLKNLKDFRSDKNSPPIAWKDKIFIKN